MLWATRLNTELSRRSQPEGARLWAFLRASLPSCDELAVDPKRRPHRSPASSAEALLSWLSVHSGGLPIQDSLPLATTLSDSAPSTTPSLLGGACLSEDRLLLLSLLNLEEPWEEEGCSM